MRDGSDTLGHDSTDLPTYGKAARQAPTRSPIPDNVTLSDAIAAWQRALASSDRSPRTLQSYAYATEKLAACAGGDAEGENGVMRLALFSDVHSNLPALDAVLADIAAVGVDARYTLGDLVGYAPWPNEVLERLASEGIPGVMGNYDDGTAFDRDECGCAYNNPVEEGLGDESFRWTKAHTSEANKAYLGSLAPEIRFEADGKRYLLVHGSPRRINEYLFEDKPDATFARIAAGAEADVIVCGHTHRPYDKHVGEARFINTGSAGKPKDGDPRACWVLLDTTSGQAEFRRVEYDVERAARAVEESELPSEFANQLREARGYHA